MYSKVMKYLSSLRFTLLLISLLGAMFLAGLWIPQQSLLTPARYSQWKAASPSLVAFFEALGLTSVYASPLMLTLWGFFFLNLSLVMWQRLPLIKKRIALPEGRPGDPATVPGYSFRASYPLPADMDGASVLGFLRRNRFTVLGDQAAFYGIKNRLSPIAFGLFHISFFFILLGGLTSLYTRFAGVLEIAQGETFQGDLTSYVPTPQMPKIGVPPRVVFTVKSIAPQMKNGTPTGLKVGMVDNLGVAQEADVNRPYKRDDTTFIVNNVGVSPLFVVTDRTGREIDGAYMKLHVMGGAQDVFSLAGYHFRARFYPDYFSQNGVPGTRSREIKNPMFDISVELKGQTIARGLVAKGGTLAFGDHQLVLRDLPLWVSFSVIKEQGLALIYTGIAIASLAIFWRFLLYRREILGAVREENGERRLLIAGRSDFYKSLAGDEFTELFGKLLGIKREN
jgi:hypothetical protein